MKRRDDDRGASLASRLRIARKHAGLSQGQVAQLMNMHRPTVSEIEAGRRRVSAEELSAFSGIYDVSLSWLLGSETENDDEQTNRFKLAARELSKLNPEDIEKVLGMLRMFRQSGDDDDK